jgi:hypothetical protein
MSINKFPPHLPFNWVRKMVKKEIWELAMKEVKNLKSSLQVKNAKQILFDY